MGRHTDGPVDGPKSTTEPRPIRRRAVLFGGGTALAATLAGCSGGGVEHGWLEVASPTNDALYDVVTTDAGPHAVGEGGRIVARTDENWSTVVPDGPAGDGNTLYGAALTDDASRLWVAGTSGAAGYYDVVADRLTDYSAPDQKTSSWADVAAAGRAGSERVALVNNSGELLFGRATTDGVQWESVTKPTGGESASAVDIAGRAVVVADTGGGVYVRRPGPDDERSWETIGIGGTDVEITDLVAVEPNRVSVAAASGSVFDYDGHRWLETEVTDGALHAIDRHGASGLATGTGGGVFELRNHEWESAETPTDRTLHGSALDAGSFSDVAVGESGTILERFG